MYVTTSVLLDSPHFHIKDTTYQCAVVHVYIYTKINMSLRLYGQGCTRLIPVRMVIQMYQLRNLINRRNVVADPKKDMNACKDF